MDAHNIWVVKDRVTVNRLRAICPETHATVQMFDVRTVRLLEKRGEKAVKCWLHQELIH